MVLDFPTADSIPEEERLASFVDMVFGGRLASILVCEKCKKVSCTYEDFNDLSLSIRAEDYEKARKRDRLRSFAHKLGMRGRTHARDHEQNGPRASSVPASPTTAGRPSDVEHSLDQVMDDSDQRRRSIDADAEPVPGEANSADMPQAEGSEDSKPPGAQEEHVSWREDVRHDDGPPRDKDEDSWVKLRRRISVGMRKGSGRKHKSKSKEPPVLVPSTQSSTDSAPKDDVVDSFVDVKMPASVVTSPNSSPALGAGIALPKFPFARRPSPSRANSGSPVPSPSMSPRLSPSAAPPLPWLDSITRSVSGAALSSMSSVQASSTQSKPSRPPKPPKPSRAQSAFLRRLLADVPSSSSTPFALFRGNSSNSIHDLADARTYFNGIGKVGVGLGGQAQSLEDCLRMFTSVEVLDGENMVGCHRCWKIERGEYVPHASALDEGRTGSSRRKEGNGDAQNCSDEENNEEDEEDDSSSNSDVKITVDTDNGEPLASSLEFNDTASAPPGLRTGDHADPSGELIARTSTSASAPEAELFPTPVPVPSISMTAPDTSSPDTQRSNSSNSEATTAPAIDATLAKNISRDSLHTPSARSHGHSRTPAERYSVASLSTDTSSLSSFGSDDDDGPDSDAEPTDTANSDSSSYRSVGASNTAQNQLSPLSGAERRLSGTTLSPTVSPSLAASSGASTRERRPTSDSTPSIPRSKRVVQRRAYKRYLIATPPPVLVVHLKRFQQVGRHPSYSLPYQFSSNLKKLDDPVSVPEYLNLQPFLLPKKSEFFANEKAKTGEKKGRNREKGDEKEKGQERCMYRLYAVVVHIGNMVCLSLSSCSFACLTNCSQLGGHYVAYTALPEAATAPPAPENRNDLNSTSSEKADAVLCELNLPGSRLASPRSTAFINSANPSMRSLPVTAEGPAATTSTSLPPSSAGGSSPPSGASTTPTLARRWCYVSDTVVRLATFDEVLKSKAYICMYERV